MKKRYKILLFFSLYIIFMLVLPFLVVKFAQVDDGMGITMLLFFLVYPIFSAWIGFLTGGEFKYFWWMPIFSFLAFPLLFSLSMGGMISELYIYSAIYFAISYAIAFIMLIVKRNESKDGKK